MKIKLDKDTGMITIEKNGLVVNTNQNLDKIIGWDMRKDSRTYIFGENGVITTISKQWKQLARHEWANEENLALEKEVMEILAKI